MKQTSRYSLATLWFIGFLPASGTIATFCAAVALWLFGQRSNNIVCALCMMVIALVSIHVALQKFKEEDPKEIIIDEVAGFWWALLGMPLSLTNLCVAFFLFRFYDISKRFGVKYWEQFPGAWGVVLDDWYAGVLTNCTVRFLLFMLNYVLCSI